MIHTINGGLDASGHHFAIVAARFNALVTGRLVAGALDCLRRHGAVDEHITLCYVPGSLEIPVVAARLAEKAEIEAIICLGAVIRGATAHFDYVAGGVASGVAEIGRSSGKPVIFGVLTTDSVEQALDRAGAKAGNRGWDAALAAVEMVDVLSQL